jgi:hypothetical protein
MGKRTEREINDIKELPASTLQTPHENHPALIFYLLFATPSPLLTTSCPSKRPSSSFRKSEKHLVYSVQERCYSKFGAWRRPRAPM